MTPAAFETFSLVAGGPFHELGRRLRLGTATEGLGRLITFWVVLTWLPLAALTVANGSFLAGRVAVPFLFDVETQIRFLIALPLLLLAELPVHRRLAVGQFVFRELVRDRDRRRFDGIVASTLRWRDAWFGELLVLALVYLVARPLWLDLVTLRTETWYATPDGGGLLLTPAGRWLAWVSVPIFQFVLYRWVYRLILWIVLLVRVSRLDLDLMAAHPDRSGGLGFLGTGSESFSTFLLAQGALLGSMIANFIFFEGARLIDYKLEIAFGTLILLALVLGPLAAFTPTIVRSKRAGLRDYGRLSAEYVRGFDGKWLREGGAPRSELIGSQDIQSLADLANSYRIVTSVRWVPFTQSTLFLLIGAVLLPLAPLVLTMFPIEQILDRLLSMVL